MLKLIPFLILMAACGDVAAPVERVPFECVGAVCTVDGLDGADASTVGSWGCESEVKATFDTGAQSGVVVRDRDGFMFFDLERVTIDRVKELDGSLCPAAPLLEVTR